MKMGTQSQRCSMATNAISSPVFYLFVQDSTMLSFLIKSTTSFTHSLYHYPRVSYLLQLGLLIILFSGHILFQDIFQGSLIIVHYSGFLLYVTGDEDFR